MNRKHDADLGELNLKLVFAEVVKKASELGWRIVRGEANNTLVLSSDHHPGRPQTIVLPINESSVNQGVLRQWREKLVRYGDPVLVAAAAGENAPTNDKVKVEAPKKAAPIEPETVEKVIEEADRAIEKATETIQAVPSTQAELDLLPESRICRLCNPPTTWVSASARGAHMKVHRKEARRAALELIMVTAQESLGVTVATPEEVAEIQQALENERTAHRTTIAALETALRELEGVRTEYGELKAAIELFQGVMKKAH